MKKRIAFLLAIIVLALAPCVALAAEDGEGFIEFLIGPLVVKKGHITVGEMLSISATFEGDRDAVPEGATVQWASSDSSKATVSPVDGDFSQTATITGISATDEVVIFAQLIDSEGEPLASESSAVISVQEAVEEETGPLYWIEELSLPEEEVVAGGKYQISAELEGERSTVHMGSTIRWESNDETIATIMPDEGEFSDTATLTAIAQGQVTVTAQMFDPEGNAMDVPHAISVTINEGVVEEGELPGWLWVALIIVIIVIVVVAVTRSRRKD